MSKRLRPRSPSTTLGVHHRAWGAIVIEEEPFTGAAVDEILVGGPQDLHDARQLLLFVFAREDREASEQLRKNATQAPHVDGHVVIHAKDNLGRAVKATLNVCVDFLMFKAATAEVDDFNGTLSWVLQEDVLWLQIAMDDSMMAHQAQGHDHLTGEPPNQGGREAHETIGLDQLVQVDTEQFHGDAQVVSEVKVFCHLDDMMLLFLVPFTKVIQNLDLD